MTTAAEKGKEILAVSKTLDEKFSTKDEPVHNTLVRVGGKNVVKKVPVIVTGMPTVDYDTLQFGGVPRGRIVEFYGPESAGKTTTALSIIAAAQQAGDVPTFVDAEHALDPLYAEKLGVNLDNLFLTQPNSGEEALQTVDALVDSGASALIVIDSVSALVPAAELAGDIGDAHVGLQARMMSQAMRILTGKCSRNGVTLIFLNQIREKIGVMFGDPETTSGGRALKFYASLRVNITRKEAIWEGTKENIIGHRINLWAKKNKGGTPFRRTEVNFIYPGDGRQPGFDKVDDTIVYANKHGLLEVSGSWYSINGEKVANGLPAFKTLLRSEPAAMAAIQKKVEAFIATPISAPGETV